MFIMFSHRPKELTQIRLRGRGARLWSKRAKGFLYRSFTASTAACRTTSAGVSHQSVELAAAQLAVSGPFASFRQAQQIGWPEAHGMGAAVAHVSEQPLSAKLRPFWVSPSICDPPSADRRGGDVMLLATPIKCQLRHSSP